jgi:pilus assembly protein CpaE
MTRIARDLEIMGMEIPTQSYVLARPDTIEQLRQELARSSDSRFVLHALAPDQPIPSDIAGNARLIVAEVDPAIPASLERLTGLRERRPDALLIAALENADLSTVRGLVRHGIQDVVGIPFDVSELFGAILDLYAQRAVAEQNFAPLTAVAGAVGGVGSTTIVTHLAAALAQAGDDARVCVVDLDLQASDISSLLGVDPTGSIIDLLEAGERLDQEMVAATCVEAGRGVFVLAAPDRIMPAARIDKDAVLRLVSLLRREFDHVLLDLPRDWTAWSLGIVGSADALFIVTDQSLRSLRHARRLLELFDDGARGRVKAIVNRAEKRLFQPIGVDEVERTLGVEVAQAIPLSRKGLMEAQEQARLLGDTDPSAPLVRAIRTLAATIRTGAGGNST